VNARDFAAGAALTVGIAGACVDGEIMWLEELRIAHL
jgi:hypothetical protein